MANDPAITTIFDGGRPTVRHLRKSKVVVVSGPEAGKEFELTKPRIGGGRSIINDIPLTDKAVSSTHLEIVGEDDGYRLMQPVSVAEGKTVPEMFHSRVQLSGTVGPALQEARHLA